MSESSEFDWIYNARHYNRCPRCKVGFLHKRVPRALIIKYGLFWMNVKRFRCSNCYKKSYVIIKNN